jgi:hypothetical protein
MNIEFDVNVRKGRGELRRVSLSYVREGRMIFKSADSTTTAKG